MKRLIILSILALLCSPLFAQTAGQYQLREYKSGGGMTDRWFTKANGQAIGFTDGVPAMIAFGAGSITSVAVSGSDGIEIDSGSSVTVAGTIAIGVNASAMKNHLGLGTLATQSATITDYLLVTTVAGTYATKAAALTTVAYVGDSIMSWTGNGNSVDEEVSERTDGEVAGVNYAHPSYGMNLISGTMTDNALSTAPKILIVEGGVNDIIAGSSFSYAEAFYNLILTKCAAADCKMLVEEIWPARGFVAMDDTKAAEIIA